jgi:hypothetical protein
LIEGLRDVDFAIERGHFLLVLDQLFFVDPINVFIDVLQLLELILQALECQCLFKQPALQFLVLTHQFSKLDLHLFPHLVDL